jgi:molecular chaperone GrpE (heat shock protein)
LSDTSSLAPTWAEFHERPQIALDLRAELAFDPRSPSQELAAVLEHSRADLEAAVRAGTESRAQGLRALAEQAVLVVELENVLARHATAQDDASLARLHDTLHALKDRMLGQISAVGLEVVRLRGASAHSVHDVIEVESWRYDDGYAGEVVVEELEAGVRLHGRPLRMGRVVMGAPRHPASHGPEIVVEAGEPELRSAAGTLAPAPSPGRIVCPVAGCGAENDVGSEFCVGCLAELAGYVRLLLHPHALFNRGLRAARAGDSRGARDCFAAVVLWQPDDVGARKAYALACMDASDRAAARRAWEDVLSRAPRDAFAERGLRALGRLPTAAAPGQISDR